MAVVVGPLQIEDQRHQGLGDEAAAIEAEMAALVRPGAIGVGRSLLEGSAHEPTAFLSGLGALAAWMKRRTRSGSFSPGARSTPEDTSTIDAPVTASASADIVRVEPARQREGPLDRRTAESAPVEREPMTAGMFGAGRRFGVEQDHIGNAPVGSGFRHIVGGGDAKGLDHAQA